MEWGVCTTAKAPLPQLLAFVAWHLRIGAKRIWVHLDDADAVTAHVLNQLDRVTAVPCDDAYWAVRGGRPQRQEPRQSYNMQRVYGETELPVIAHVDVDEFIYSEHPVSEVLGAWNGVDPFLRMAPAEALSDPSLEDDIFTARQFRLPFRGTLSAGDRQDILGKHAPLLPHNMLSHRVGKSFFRTGLDGFVPKIHAGSYGADRPMNVPLTSGVVVLHFHAQDKAEWLAALPHRTVNGAYRFNEPLADFLTQATMADVDAFYDATQLATPKLVTALARHGLLIEADLRLKETVAALPF